jgi:hypothetical protein
VNDGVRILYNLFPTPDHLRWPGMENAPGRYPSFPGSNTTPNNMNDVKAFVTALLTRYNVIPNGQMKIHAIEVMNEPNAAGSIAGDSSPFWLGRDYDDTTAGRNRRLDDLATLHKAVYEAVKAADPRVLVLGPPFIPGSYSAANSLAYYNRGILGGGTPLDYTDVLTCHPYHGSGQSSSGSAAASYIHTVCKSYWDAMRPVHATKPIWSTEAGNEASASASDHATAIKRKAMICAGLGMEVMCWYSYETSVDGLGQPNVNTGPRDALRDVAAKMVGKTMTRCSILSNGTVWATFSDGTSWNV